MRTNRVRAIALVALLGTSVFWAAHHASGQQASTQPPQATPAGQNSYYSDGKMFIIQPIVSTAETDRLLNDEANANREVAKLMNDYSKADGDAQRAKVKLSLTAALEKEFDLQQKRRELELTALEARLKTVRELMQRRSSERQTIVEKRADQLLREADGLGWTPPPGIKGQQAIYPTYTGPVPATNRNGTFQAR